VVPVRIDSEYAVDTANDTASRPANDTTNNAADRPEHAVPGIGPAVSPVVYSCWYALRLRNNRHGNKDAQRNHPKHSHQEHHTFVCSGFQRPPLLPRANRPACRLGLSPPRTGPVAPQSPNPRSRPVSAPNVALPARKCDDG
jgi:hypothetical protein